MATASVSNEVTTGGAAQTKQETELFRQSYSISIPKTMEGVTAVFTGPDGKLNEKALLLCVRAGIMQISNNRLRQKATAKDAQGNPEFQPVDSIYDATPLLLEAPQRQALSNRDKLHKSLTDGGLPEAAIQQILAKYDETVGTAQATEDVSVNTNEFVLYLGKDGKQLIMRTPRTDDEE